MATKLIFENELLDLHVRQAQADLPIAHLRLKSIDEMMDGVHAGRITVLSGRPGAFKTTLMGQVVDALAMEGCCVIVNTLEMTARHWVAQSIARLSNGALTVAGITRPENDVAIKCAAKAYGHLIARNVAYIEEPHTTVELSALVAEAQAQRNMPVVLVVDYLQIMPTVANRVYGDERLAIKDNVSGIRQLARSCNVPVFLVSSINRANYSKAEPGMEALGGASAIEYSADTILHMSPASEKACAGLSFAGAEPIAVTALKNRYAPKGTVVLACDSNHATFREPDAAC